MVVYLLAYLLYNEVYAYGYRLYEKYWMQHITTGSETADVYLDGDDDG